MKKIVIFLCAAVCAASDVQLKNNTHKELYYRIVAQVPPRLSPEEVTNFLIVDQDDQPSLIPELAYDPTTIVTRFTRYIDNSFYMFGVLRPHEQTDIMKIGDASITRIEIEYEGYLYYCFIAQPISRSVELDVSFDESGNLVLKELNTIIMNMLPWTSELFRQSTELKTTVDYWIHKRTELQLIARDQRRKGDGVAAQLNQRIAVLNQNLDAALEYDVTP